MADLVANLSNLMEERTASLSGRLRESLDEIKNDVIEKLKKYKHIKNEKIDPRHVECLIIRSEGSINKTETALDKYYTMKLNLPKFFLNRDPAAPDFSLPLQAISCSIQHPVSMSNQRVLCLQCSKDVTHLNLYAFYKILLMFFEIKARRDSLCNVCCVLDYINLTEEHLAKFDDTAIQEVLFALQGPFLINIKEFHFVNVPKCAEAFIEKFKTWLTEDQQTFIHSDYESLQRVLGKNVLPKDFGGDQPSMKETQEKWCMELKKWRNIFVEDDTPVSTSSASTRTSFRNSETEEEMEENVQRLIKCEITEIFNKKILKELNLTKEKVEKAVQEVVEWMKAEPHLKNVKPDTRQIECVFVRSKGKIDDTKQAIDDYYAMKTEMPEFFTNRNPAHKDFKIPFLGFSCAISLDVPTSRSRVVCLKSQPDASNFDINDFYKIMLMFLEIKTRLDYADEYIFVLDYSNLTQEHLPKINREAMKNVIVAVKGLGLIQLKGFHIINFPSFAEPIVTSFKYVLDPEVQRTVIVHENLESLHKVVDKTMLPSDFGGVQSSMKELEDNWFHELSTWQDWFVEEEGCMSDESKRFENAESLLSNDFGP